MKGWQLIEIRREIEGRFYRMTAPSGVPATEMIEVMKDWIYELEQISAEAPPEVPEEEKECQESCDLSPPLTEQRDSHDASLTPQE